MVSHNNTQGVFSVESGQKNDEKTESRGRPLLM